MLSGHDVQNQTFDNYRLCKQLWTWRNQPYQARISPACIAHCNTASVPIRKRLKYHQSSKGDPDTVMASVYKAVSKSSSSSSKPSVTTNGAAPPKNKQRVLILSSRGVTYRHRHLLNDLYSLLPHSRKDAKLDTKTKLYQLNELAELYNCNNVLFFEARKGKDLYVWMSKAPNGPTVKMHMQNCRVQA